MEHKFEIEIAHDKHALNVWTHDGLIDCSLGEAESLKERLTIAIEALKNRKTLPSPEPLSYGDMGLVSSNTKLGMFAEVGRPTLKTKVRGEIGDPYLYVAGCELDLDSAKKLNKWLEGAIDYIENGDPGGELCVKEKEK